MRKCRAVHLQNREAVATGYRNAAKHSKIYHAITEPRSLSERVKQRHHTFEDLPRNYEPGLVTSHSTELGVVTVEWSRDLDPVAQAPRFPNRVALSRAQSFKFNLRHYSLDRTSGKA